MLKFDDKYSDTRISDLHIREEENLIQAKAPQLGFDYVNLNTYTINPEALSTVKEEVARSAKIVAFELNRDTVSVACKNPNNPKTQEVLLNLQKNRLIPKVYMCSDASLEHAWQRYGDIVDSSAEKKSVFEINSTEIDRLNEQIKQKEDVIRLLKKINDSNNTRRISETLELVFAGALALNASDIHIEPKEASIRLRYRFDGVLHDIADLDIYIYGRMISRLKLLSGMVLNTKNEAQDGRFTFDASTKEVEVRSSIIPGAFGESIVMRLLDPTAASFTLEKIKLNPYIKDVVMRELKKPNGLIITTGPTGSGKTTALYAFLKETHTESIKIITIENPVEYKLDGIVQTQTSEDYSFASGLRAILRQDPDVIMVGEIRDREVAETAVHAAQTGHLVFSTLHTNSAFASFARLIDLGVDPRAMGISINLVIGQRLIRLLCEKCKKSYEANQEEIDLLRYIMKSHPHPTEIVSSITLYKPNGCSHCDNTGFKGRAGIFEGVQVDESVEKAILRDPRESTILEASRPQKIPTMAEDGADKVIQGLTSINELERVVELPRIESASKKNTDESEDDEISNQDFLSHVV